VGGAPPAFPAATKSRSFRVRLGFPEDPLESPYLAAELVLRCHEDSELGRAPLQQLTA